MDVDEPNRIKPRAAVWLLIAFTVSVAVSTLVSWKRGGVVTKIRLADGESLEFKALTIGTNHSFHPHPSWRRFLHQHLGVGSAGVERTTSTLQPSPVLWLELHDHDPDTDTVSEELVTKTRTGQRLKVYSGWTYGPDDHEIRSADLINVSRREPMFVISPVGSNQPTLRISNPMYGQKWPEWRTDALPVTNTVGDLDFVLSDAELQVAEFVRFVPTMQVYQHGQRLKGWKFIHPMLSDPTGNHHTMIPTNEPAWRVEMTAIRLTDAAWPTNQFVKIDVPKIPPPGMMKRISIGRPVAEWNLEELWIGGRGEFVVNNTGVATATTNSHTGLSLHVQGNWSASVKSSMPWIALQYRTSSTAAFGWVVLEDSSGTRVPDRPGGNDSSFDRYWKTHRIDSSSVKPGPLSATVYVQAPMVVSFTIDPAKLRRVPAP